MIWEDLQYLCDDVQTDEHSFLMNVHADER